MVVDLLRDISGAVGNGVLCSVVRVGAEFASVVWITVYSSKKLFLVHAIG